MRGEVRIGRSIYGVVVINGSLCSRVYGIIPLGGCSSYTYLYMYNYVSIETCLNCVPADFCHGAEAD